MLLIKCVPVLNLDVLQIAKSGYFSAVLFCIRKSTDPAS